MKFSIKDFFSKCDRIRMKERSWSHLLKKSLMENFIFCAVRSVITFIRVILLNHTPPPMKKTVNQVNFSEREKKH